MRHLWCCSHRRSPCACPSAGGAQHDGGDPSSRPGRRGCFDVPGAALGHRRLAIIDRAGGQQPMAQRRRLRAGSSSTARSTTIATLRPRARRHAAIGSAPQSDTEAIVHAYEEYGPACVERLEGMFAFAIYDETTRELFIARDRLGKKPLFYADVRRRAALRQRDQGARAEPALERRRRPRRRSKAICRSATSSRRPRSTGTSTSCCRATGCALRDGRRRDAPVLGRQRVRHRSARRQARSSTTSMRLLRQAVARAARKRSAARRVPVAAASTPASSCRTWPSALGDRLVTASVGFGEAAHNELDAAGLTARHFSTPSLSGGDRAEARRGARPVVAQLRRAVRRLVGDSDLVRVADGAAARDRGAQRRRRRRSVRRLRLPLRAACARERRRRPHAGRAGAARLAWLRRALAAIAATAAAASRWLARLENLAARSRPLPITRISAFSSRQTRAALLGLAPRSRSGEQPGVRAGHRAVPALPVHERRAARRIRRPEDLSAERSAREGRSHEHGAQPRGPLPAARSARRRAGVPDSGDDEDAAACSRKALLRGLARRRLPREIVAAAEARLHRADRRVDRRSRTASASARCPGARLANATLVDTRRVARLFAEHIAGRDHSFALWAVWMLERWARQCRKPIEHRRLEAAGEVA